MKSKLSASLLVFGCLANFVTFLHGQKDAQVSKLISNSADGLVFEISLPSTNLKQGDDIVVNIAVRNTGRKTVQLIRSTQPPSFNISDLWVINIPSPYIYPNAHSRVEYAFIRIGAGESFRSTVKIPAKIYVDDTKYSFENAAIEASFLYLVADRLPEECKETAYSLPCLYHVSQNGKELTIGRLVLDIPERK